MEYREKIDWLWRYRESLRREHELAEEVERLQAEAAHITPLLTGMPCGGGGADKLPRAVERIVAARQELEAQVNLCGAARLEVVAAIECVTEPRRHEILRRRYLLGQRWEQIAVEMHLDYRWVTRLHRRAVEQLPL